MAFTSRAPREAGKVDVSTPVNLGPGSYDPSFKHEAHHASAPFGSTAARKVGAIAGLVTPGPGTYQVAVSPSNKNPFVIRSERVMTYLGNYESYADLPGPGSYAVPSSFSTDGFRKGDSRPATNSNAQNMFHRIQSAPSIPVRTQSFGYDETPTGQLVRCPPQSSGHTGVKGDVAGPGHYDALSAFNRLQPTGGCAAFGLSKVPRLSAEAVKAAEGVLAATYSESAPPTAAAPPKLLKPTATFASRVARDPAARNVDMPGPGSYNVHLYGAIKPSRLPVSMQCFGSSSKRDLSLARKTDVPGPGTYVVDPKKVVKSRRDGGDHPGFGSTVERKLGDTRPPLAPGPGQYDESNRLNWVSDLARKQVSRVSSFGSTAPRFVARKGKERASMSMVDAAISLLGGDLPESEDAPGPGHYEVERRSTPGILRKGPMASWGMSRVKRFDRPLVHDGIPPPGTYKIPDDWAKPKPRGYVAPFGSRGDRWNTPAYKDINCVPGPGQYDTVAAPRLEPVVEKPGIMGTAPRTAEFRSRDLAPGPGTYDVSMPLVKRSFNVTIDSN
jgi:hypothetical protein